MLSLQQIEKLSKLRCYASKFSTDITVPVGRKNQQKHLNRVGGFLNSLKLLTKQRECNITFFLICGLKSTVKILIFSKFSRKSLSSLRDIFSPNKKVIKCFFLLLFLFWRVGKLLENIRIAMDKKRKWTTKLKTLFVFSQGNIAIFTTCVRLCNLLLNLQPIRMYHWRGCLKKTWEGCC